MILAHIVLSGTATDEKLPRHSPFSAWKDATKCGRGGGGAHHALVMVWAFGVLTRGGVGYWFYWQY